MTFQDTLVNMREAMIAALLRIDRRAVLNQLPAGSTPYTANGKSIAAELKRAVNMFKAIAMDENGEHVNYPKLAESKVYQEYQTGCSPLLQEFDPASLQTRQEKLAFWINLYNALIIDAVIRFKVTKSVAEGPVGLVRFFRKAAYTVSGQRLTAEDIEHGILRANRGNPFLPGPQFGPRDARCKMVLDFVDPRIHFALNCASRSCPPVGVYTPEAIDQQLDLAARNFISQEVRGDRDNETLHLSQIFNWYAKDFGGQTGVLDFVSAHLSEKSRDWLTGNPSRLKIQYLPYDWGLNI